MVAGLDRNSATLMPYYIYIYIHSRHSPETRFSSTHAYVYDRPARIKPCFVLMCSTARERERDWYSKGDGNSTFPSPIFAGTKRESLRFDICLVPFRGTSLAENESRKRTGLGIIALGNGMRPLLSSCRRVSSVLLPLRSWRRRREEAFIPLPFHRWKFFFTTRPRLPRLGYLSERLSKLLPRMKGEGEECSTRRSDVSTRAFANCISPSRFDR